jgi:hypothetical protein
VAQVEVSTARPRKRTDTEVIELRDRVLGQLGVSA